MNGDIEATLNARGELYGSFVGVAGVSLAIKGAMAEGVNWAALDPDMREALEMIAHKAARILNGDPCLHDSWHDIAGYATLVADRLER